MTMQQEHLDNDLDTGSTGEGTYAQNAHNHSQFLVRKECSMNFGDQDALLGDRTFDDAIPQKRSRSNQKSDKMPHENKQMTPRIHGGVSSHAPESESILSMRHLSEGGKKMRTTDPLSSQFNMLNMYIGIAIIALPKAVSEVGFVGAIFGLIIVNLLSLGSSWFLLKARNRFKSQRIIDLPDLAMVTCGPMMKLLCQSILILANTAFIMAQGMYLGGQADLLACDWLDRPEECGKNKKFYSFAMITLMCPILLVPDFKKLSIFSSFFVTFCVISLLSIFAFEIQAIYYREQGTPVQMTYSDATGHVKVASDEQIEQAYQFELFDFTFFPLFLGEVMSIFEGNVAILNLYSQQNKPGTMFLQTAVTHALVGMLCIIMGCLSYGAYGTMTQDIVFYNLPKGSSVANLVSVLYMLNIVGSISMTIQPIYGLIEKGTVSHEEDEHPVDRLEDIIETDTEITSISENDDELRSPGILKNNQSKWYNFMFTFKRLIVPYLIISLSTLFPNVNSILSLIGGDICGVLLIVLPVLFYRAAYVERPSKKSRVFQSILGVFIVMFTLPIGIIGIYQNMKALLYATEE